MASQMENAATEQLAPATSETHDSITSPVSIDDSPDVSLSTSSAEANQASPVRLYLSGLGRNTTKATLESFFAEYSPKDIVVKDRGDEISFKFAFLTLDAASAETIMDESPHEIDGSTCRVERTRVALRSGRSRDKQTSAAKTGPETDNHASAIRKLFLGGLSASTTSDDLRAYFSPQYGEVVDACVMVDSTNGRPRGFGFVSLASAAAVQRVIDAGRYHRIGERDVDVKPAVPRDVMARGEVSMETAKPRRHASANAKGFGDEKAAMMMGNEIVSKLSSTWYPPHGVQEGVWHGMSPAAAAAPMCVMPGVMWPAAVAAPGAMTAPTAMVPQPMVPHMPSGVTHGVPVYGGYAPMAYAAAPMGMAYVPPAAPYGY